MFKWRDRKPRPSPDEGDPATRALEQLQEAIQLLQAGQPQAALTLLEEATLTLERVAAENPRRDLSGQLASAYTNKASASHQLGDTRTALAIYDQAIAIYERLLLQEGQMQWSRTLAMTYTNKGHAASQLGNHRAAGALYLKAVNHYERLVDQEGRKDLAPLLARAYLTTVRALRLDGNRQEAEPLVERAAALGERLISQGGHDDLAPEVSILYMDQALALSRRGDSLAGVKLYDRTLALRERLVHRTGDPDMASAYLTKTVFATLAEDSQAAMSLFDRAITLYDRLVNQKGRKELGPNLAVAYLDMALVKYKTGDLTAARPLFDQAVTLYDHIINDEGRQDLTPDRDRARRLRSELPRPAIPSNLTDGFDDDDDALAGHQKTVVGDLDEMADGVLPEKKTAKTAEDRTEILHRKQVELQDKSIALYERLTRREGNRQLTPLLGAAYLAKADRLLDEGDTQGALPLYEQGIALLERVVNDEGQRDWQLLLAQGYCNKGRALHPRLALAVIDQAIALLTPPTQSADDPEPWPDLGRAYHTKSLTLLKVGAKMTADQSHAQALALLEHLVYREGRLDLRADFELVRDHTELQARATPAPAPFLEPVDHAESFEEHDSFAADAMESTNGVRLEEGDPRPEDMAMASLREAIAIRQTGKPEAALPFFDDAVARFEQLVEREGRRDLQPDLERARKSRKVALAQMEAEHP